MVRVDTTNPPGAEAALARLLAERLEEAGMRTRLVPLGPGRESLVATLAAVDGDAPWLVLSGHLDTVPVGPERWSTPPFSAEIDGDRLLGRGSSDMKAGVAALVCAAEAAAAGGPGRRSLAFVATAGEEDGCHGARSVSGLVPPADALLVAEPTNNQVAVGHKGVLWLRVETTGVAAHASTPERGDNAIVNLAAAIGRLEARVREAPAEEHALLGRPTFSVGRIDGGSATNIVPASARAWIDVRTTPAFPPDAAEGLVQEAAGERVSIVRELDLAAVATAADHPWVQRMRAAFGDVAETRSMGYFTDASVLSAALGDAATVICGPGDPAQAHARDEWCSLSALQHAAEAYSEVCQSWMGRRSTSTR
jgi:succinyl-diaminopimelate desuccinylase